MKKGFGLPQAIMIMIFIATIAMMGVRYAKVSVNHYTDTYAKEQAQLFLQNAKEWALYQISGHDRSGGTCWSGGTFKRNDMLTKKPKIDFIATVTVERYFLLAGSTDATTCGTLTTTIQTPESHGMVQLLIEVVSSGTKNSIVLQDRSIQRP